MRTCENCKWAIKDSEEVIVECTNPILNTYLALYGDDEAEVTFEPDIEFSCSLWE